MGTPAATGAVRAKWRTGFLDWTSGPRRAFEGRSGDLEGSAQSGLATLLGKWALQQSDRACYGILNAADFGD